MLKVVFAKGLKNKKQRIIFIVLVLIGAWYVSTLIFKKPFLYAGTLEVTKVDIAARLPSAVATISVQEGDRVETDQLLIEFGCEDFKIAAALAEMNYNRNIKLLGSGAVTEEIMDELRTKMEEANTNVKWCTLKAPLKGTVLSRYHEPGEWLMPGTNVLTLANIQDIWAYIYVPQPEVASLAFGMALKGRVAELNDRVFEGRIIKISDEAEFTPKNVQTQNERERLIYGVKVSFKAANTTEILKPGMTIEVELPTK